MAIRNIRTDEDPILRKISKEVNDINDRMKTLISDMFETMDYSNGVGLAAPQVGILRRIITLDDQDGLRGAFINPKIIEKDGEQIGPEGCLSVPGKQGTVNRANHIVVTYMDENGEEKTLEAQGFTARIFQHEIDHLNGILYTDLATEIHNIQDEDDEVQE